MVKTIRVSEDFHRWVKAHTREGETMEETLRRLTRTPSPEEFAGVLSPERVDEAEAAIERLDDRDRKRREDIRGDLE
jgi:negative regulator of replication initiation